jgi:hypothetical protein
MTGASPESEASLSGSEINPAKTDLIKIAGTLIVLVAGVIIAFGVLLCLRRR